MGFTNGCFDLIHPGHLSLLKQAKQSVDKLIVGLNTDISVSKLKGPNRPINNQYARALLLASLEYVDAVILFGEATPLNLVTLLLPDVLIKGADYKVDEVVGADVVIQNGGKVSLINLVKGESSTKLIAKASIPAKVI